MPVPQRPPAFRECQQASTAGTARNARVMRAASARRRRKNAAINRRRWCRPPAERVETDPPQLRYKRRCFAEMVEALRDRGLRATKTILCALVTYRKAGPPLPPFDAALASLLPQQQKARASLHVRC